MINGLARISMVGQCVNVQITALTAAGAEKVFREVASSAKTDCTQLRWTLDALGPGDVQMVAWLGRLARSTFDLFAISIPASGRFVATITCSANDGL